MNRSYSKRNQYLPRFKHLKNDADVKEIKNIVDKTSLREYDKELIKQALDNDDVVTLTDQSVEVRQGGDTTVWFYR